MSRRQESTIPGVPTYLYGEREAIEQVIRLAEMYGYGNLISELKTAWSEHLQSDGMDKECADMAGGHICVWCKVDSRTGKKVK